MQERTITELRSFIESYMRPMMALVAKEKEDICHKYKEEFGKVVPDDVMEDVFSLFDLYNSNVSKAPNTTEMD